MLGVAVVGLGYWGPNLVRNLAALPDVELRLAADIDPERCAAIRRAYPQLNTVSSIEDVLADKQCDAVAIATPVETHYALARAALLAGKHVLVEKPLATDVSQAEELVRLAEDRHRVLMVDHVYVYSNPVRLLRTLIDRGELGELQFIDSVRVNLGLFQRAVNVVWDLAPHDLSIIDYLIDRMPETVGLLAAAHTHGGHEDVGYLSLDFGNGLIANIHVNWLSPVKVRYFMIGGSKKSVIYNDLKRAEAVKIYDSGISLRQDDAEGRRRMLIDYRTGDVLSPHIPHIEPLAQMCRHFVECIRKDQQPLTDGLAGLRVVRILDAAHRSRKAGGARIRP